MESSPSSSSQSKDEVPLLFRCPISMEVMQDPVTISTGVTYERKNIEKWFYVYKKSICPATMQRLDNFDLTPNHTLYRLISSGHGRQPASPPREPTSITSMAEVVVLMKSMESTPFKVSYLKKLRSMVAKDEKAAADVVNSGGIEALTSILKQVLSSENTDFDAFRTCEEATGVLHHLPLTSDTALQTLTSPESIDSMTTLLQRGSAGARLHTITILQKIAKTGRDWSCTLANQNIEFYKSLVELLSDEILTHASSATLDVLIEITTASKRRRIRAVEAGAICVLIELLPDANRHKCEKMLFLMKLLCECPDGRAAVAEHGMGVAVVSKKILRVSELATKIAVKILCLVCSSLPTDKVIDEMIVFGAVKKLLGLMHMDCSSSTKHAVIKIMKLHGGIWQHYPCFPIELRDFLRLVIS